MRHACHAAGCDLACPPRHLFCARHWSMVPPVMQRSIWTHYRAGQERDKAPTMTYCAVQRLTVAYIARAEGREHEHLVAFARRHLVSAERRSEPRADLSALFALVGVDAEGAEP